MHKAELSTCRRQTISVYIQILYLTNFCWLFCVQFQFSHTSHWYKSRQHLVYQLQPPTNPWHYSSWFSVFSISVFQNIEYWWFSSWKIWGFTFYDPEYNHVYSNYVMHSYPQVNHIVLPRFYFSFLLMK